METTATKSTTSKPAATKSVNLALQGGGSHGAFTWGALDYLLEDGRLSFEGISATSAGAMNAVALAQGLLKGDRDEARHFLASFWEAISDAGQRSNPFSKLPSMPKFGGGHKEYSLEGTPAYYISEFVTRTFSPYQFNPFNVNPLKDLLKKQIDFEAVRKHSSMKINLCATNVETGKIRVFERKELTVDAVLASACLPFLFQAVEIEGEFYWDGGYVGNPAIYPLIYGSKSHDVVIVHVNPIVRKGVPKTAADILNRINEVSFNSSLMREMRAVAFASKLIREGKVNDEEMKQMHIHSIRSDEEMAHHGVSSKMNTDWDFLIHLRDEGRAIAKEWLTENFAKVGKTSSVDLHKEFL